MHGTGQSKILIAEDNELNRRVVHGMLEHRGHALVVVSDGLEAMRALEAEHFDLLILDCLMPGMDGFTTTRAIRNGDPERVNTRVPILAVTALASDGDRERCLAAGMDAYISKPVRAETLFRQVDALLSSDRAASEDTAANLHDSAGTPERSYPGLQDIIHSMSSILIRDCLKWQTDLQSLLDERNLESIRLLAHKIRGTADILQNTNLSESAIALETSAMAGDEHGAAVAVPRLVSALDALVKAVNHDD